MNTYKITMYVKCDEDDAVALRKSLAQTVYDEFELGSAFGVSVTQEDPPDTMFDRIMALCMVEMESGISSKQVGALMNALPADRTYMPVECHGNNTSAYGFVDAEYFQIHDYNTEYFEGFILPVLEDMCLEIPDGQYMTPDGRQFYMGYFRD